MFPMMMVGVLSLPRRLECQLEVAVLACERVSAAMMMGMLMGVSSTVGMIVMATGSADPVKPTLLKTVLSGAAQIIAVDPGTNRSLLAL